MRRHEAEPEPVTTCDFTAACPNAPEHEMFIAGRYYHVCGSHRIDYLLRFVMPEGVSAHASAKPSAGGAGTLHELREPAEGED